MTRKRSILDVPRPKDTGLATFKPAHEGHIRTEVQFETVNPNEGRWEYSERWWEAARKARKRVFPDGVYRVTLFPTIVGHYARFKRFKWRFEKEENGRVYTRVGTGTVRASISLEAWEKLVEKCGGQREE